MHRAWLVGLLALSFTFVQAPIATAGPVEQFVQVALHPSDPDTMLIRYAFGGEGLLITHDAGATWSLVCNSFIDPSTSARNGVAAVTGDGAIMLGVFDGAWTADDAGCGWTLSEGVGERWVADMAQDPDDPDVTYAVTANGGDGVMNGVLKREAGDSWSELGPQDELMIFRMQVVSTGTGKRFVQSATRGMLPATINGMMTEVPNYLIRVSDDDADTFQEYPFPAPEEGSFYLVAVDPSNPDRMLAYVDRDESANPPHMDLILVSRDGGQSFEPYLEDQVLELSSAVILPDGQVLIGDRGTVSSDIKGLWSAPSLDDTPTALRTDYAIGCLAYQAATDTVFGCGLRELGTLDRASGEIDRIMKIDEVQSLAQCEGEDVVTACQVQLCKDYCLLGHFPTSPACEVYQMPSCGPCSDIPPAPTCHMMAGAGGMGGAGAGGTAGSAAGSGDAGTSGSGEAGSDAGSGGSGGSAGTGGEPPPKKKKSSGCTVSAPDQDAGALYALVGLPALALPLRARRRGALNQRARRNTTR